MVSLRCKLVIQSELERLDIDAVITNLGEVNTQRDLTDEELQNIRVALLDAGFELLEDKKRILIEKIKSVIIEMVHYQDEQIAVNFSDYLSEKLQYDYTYLSNLFTEVKGISIEHYIISHKIERAKELIIYNELTLTQIAKKMHYSSVAHLSRQFKKVTGLTPSFFRKLTIKKRIALEKL